MLITYCISYFMTPNFSYIFIWYFIMKLTIYIITYGSIFFVFYVLGLYWFGVRAGIASNSLLAATLSGAASEENCGTGRES